MTSSRPERDPHRDVPNDAPPIGRSAESLFQTLYTELRSIAGKRIRAEWRKGNTLQSGDLVNEAYLRLRGDESDGWGNRTDFRAAAAVAMRRILCDHARKRNALKRAGKRQRITLIDEILDVSEQAIDPLVLDDLLSQLAAKDERAARVVELRFFGSLTMDEVADALDVSKRTAENDWTFARSWLFGKLAEDRTR